MKYAAGEPVREQFEIYEANFIAELPVAGHEGNSNIDDIFAETERKI